MIHCLCTTLMNQEQKEKRMWMIQLQNIIGGSCHKYHFCCDKQLFVVTKHLLSWQNNACCSKTFVTASILLSRQKTCLVTTNASDTTKLLSWQKWHLWQLPQMIAKDIGNNDTHTGTDLSFLGCSFQAGCFCHSVDGLPGQSKEHGNITGLLKWNT